MSSIPARRVTVGLLLSMALLTGCGYTLRSPFARSVRTVYIPVFRSVSFHRDVDKMLTEALQKEAIRRGITVVGKPEGADTVLEGTVNFADKNLVVENPFNLPRQLTAQITVAVTWKNNRLDKNPADPVVISEIVNFIPEVGETSQSAFQKACDRLAQRIVGMMEEQW